MGNQVTFLVPFVRVIMRNEVNIWSDITSIFALPDNFIENISYLFDVTKTSFTSRDKENNRNEKLIT